MCASKHLLIQKVVLKKGLPIANFNTNVTNGNVPLTVQFTDLSTDATGQGWNFGDGATSTEMNPTHTYLAAGVYTVNLDSKQRSRYKFNARYNKCFDKAS